MNFGGAFKIRESSSEFCEIFYIYIYKKKVFLVKTNEPKKVSLNHACQVSHVSSSNIISLSNDVTLIIIIRFVEPCMPSKSCLSK